MDNRELERALNAVSDKLDLVDVKLQEIEKKMAKLYEDADDLSKNLKTIRRIV